MTSNNNLFYINNQKCSICGGNVTKFAAMNIFTIKTAHSETPISVILERLKSKSSKNILNECLNNYCDEKTCACNDCLIKIDEYDLAYTTAQRIENELINLLLNSNEKRHKTDITPIVSFKKETENIDWNEGGDNDDNDDDDDDDDDNNEDFNFKDLNKNNFVAECRICKIKFNTIEELNQHEHHKTNRNSTTNQSNIKTSSYKNVQLSGKVIACQICNKVFAEKKQFMLHFKKHKSSENTRNKNKCEKCEKTFATEVLLEIHQAVHEGRSELECQYCSKVISSKGGMVKHLRIHTQELQYQCELCGKRFVHHSSFRMHKYAHYNIRTVTCKICNRKFRGTPHLNRHMRVHTGEKPFSCSICGRAFAQRYNMNMHFKSHDTNKKFDCTDCGLSFDSKKNLKDHLLKAHNLVLGAVKDKADRPRRIPVYSVDDTDEVKQACENIKNI